jgi:hypothetical protein
VLYDTEKALTELSKRSLTFPATVGKASAAQVITTVSNGGHGELTIISISASDGFAQTNTLYGAPRFGRDLHRLGDFHAHRDRHTHRHSYIGREWRRETGM